MAAFAVQIFKNTHSSFSTVHDWSTSYHIRCLLYCWDEYYPQKNLSLQHIKYQIGCVLSQRCSSITPGTKYKIHKMSLGLNHTAVLALTTCKKKKSMLQVQHQAGPWKSLGIKLIIPTITTSTTSITSITST